MAKMDRTKVDERLWNLWIDRTIKLFKQFFQACGHEEFEELSSGHGDTAIALRCVQCGGCGFVYMAPPDKPMLLGVNFVVDNRCGGPRWSEEYSDSDEWSMVVTFLDRALP